MLLAKPLSLLPHRVRLAPILLMLVSGMVSAAEPVRLASTTSAIDTGLLAELLEGFEKRFGLSVEVIPVGSHTGLQMAKEGRVDAVLGHAPGDEQQFVREGHGVNLRQVMQNDFVIVGPEADPAGIDGMNNVSEALKKIAETKSPFVTRSTDSGTHRKEQALWASAGIEPSGDWYRQLDIGMGDLLQAADDNAAYALTDHGTFVSYSGDQELKEMVGGGPLLSNSYSIIATNPERHPEINYLGAMQLIAWITSQEGQTIIREFGKAQYGAPLFRPLAIH